MYHMSVMGTSKFGPVGMDKSHWPFPSVVSLGPDVSRTSFNNILAI